MNKVISLNSPIEIIASTITAEEDHNLKNFITQISKLYQYELFKPMLDLVATLCFKRRLRFQVYDRRFFEFDEGNCKTIEGGSVNKFLNKFKSELNYIITIKKNTVSVIVHEIAHMMEKEGEFHNLSELASVIKKDMEISNTNNVSLKAAVKQIMVDEVASYPENQVNSELFARFFELLSHAKEISGLGAQFGYVLLDIYQFFANTIKFLSGDFYKTIMSKIDINISNQSIAFIKPIEQIQHKWSDEKVKSVHKDSTKPQWSRSIKSIKSDPFS